MTKAPLTARNAEIRTATVEMKTLTITGKQVTLAVYRQIPEKSIVGSDGDLAGEPWGWVNHCPDKSCKNSGPHRHFIWRDSDQLRRATHSQPTQTPEQPVSVDSDLIRPWLTRAALAGWHPNSPELAQYGCLTVPFDSGTAEIYGGDLTAVPGLWTYLWPSSGNWSMLRDRFPDLSQIQLMEMAANDQRQLALARIQANADGLPPAADLTARIEAQIGQVVARRTQQCRVWRSLLDLPRLFIAI